MDSNWLKYISKYHKEWIKVINSFGEYLYAEDIVQEMYIRVYKYSSEEKIVKAGEVNKGFIWFVLRNIYVDYCKQKSKIEKIKISEDVQLKYEPLDKEFEMSRSRIDKKIDKEIDSWHWYDSMLFKLYKESGKSMRDISAETNISLTSIFHTIKHCKQRLVDKVGEDYEDYINEDYEHIKR